jgi:hypothetical protein
LRWRWRNHEPERVIHSPEIAPPNNSSTLIVCQKIAFPVKTVERADDRTGGGEMGVEQQAFLEAGYTPRHVLEILTIIALETPGNYTIHLAHPPLDAPFEPQRWSRKP